MKIRDLLFMSITNLWKRKLRTILTVLGVVIGVTSIVVMISLGNGLKQSVMDQMSSYANIMQITVRSNGSNYGGSVGNTDHLLSDTLIRQLCEMEHVEAVYPKLELNAEIRTGKYSSHFMIYGVTKEDLQNNYKIGEGVFPSEGNELELFFGNTTITDFYNTKTKKNEYYDNGKLPNIDFTKDACYLVMDSYNQETQQNVSKKVNAKAVGKMEGGPEDWSMGSWYVYTEINSLKKMLQKTYKNGVIPDQPTKKNGKPYKEIFYSELIVQADSIENVTTLTDTLNEMGYSAYNDADWIKQQQDQMNMIQMVLGLIGAVSLFVAAIGITNTMMMSIYERTKEIGVMKVLGCDIRNIQTLFLMEAGFIGFLGGVVGVLFSIVICKVITKLIEVSGAADQMGMGANIVFAVPLWLPGVAIVFAILIGMLSGFIPSLRAMKLSPLAAIRNE